MSTHIISPSILSADFSNLKSEIIGLENSSCEYIHVDIMDGHFVPNISFGQDIVKSIRPYSQKTFDVHLMISHPEKYIKNFVDAGSDIILIHREINGNIIEILKEIRNYNKKCGIVYNPDTNISDIENYFPYIDQILLMSVFPGFGGQKFIENTLERGYEVRKKISQSNLDIDLEIDGGVNGDNINVIKEAGFNIIVAGSYIFNSQDIEAKIQTLR